MATRTRLLKELSSRSEEFKLQPVADDLTHWTAIIPGPEATPFEGGRFTLDFRLPENYPFSSPKVIFKTRIFHPNIHFDSGEICLDVLKTDWSPAWSLESICRAVVALLSSPNAESPLNCDAGNMIRAGDMRAFNSMAKMYTYDLAMN